MLEWNDFNNSKSTCGPNASQVWAQSDLGFWSRCGFKLSKMAAWWPPSWIAERNHFSNSESHVSLNDASSHQVSAQSNLQFGGDDV